MGIKVDLYGDEKGVNGEEVGPGRYWVGIGERLYEFPTFQQNYVWTADQREGSPNNESFTFQTKEGLPVNADIGISYTIEKDKVSNVFQKYRRGVAEITDTFLRAHVRDAFNEYAASMPVEGVYGEQKMELLGSVEKRVIEEVAPIGINVHKIFLIGEFRLPKSVTQALEAKIAVTQKAQQRENELREAEAEAKKAIAKAQGEAQSKLVKAEAQAKANLILAKSLTRELVEYERIKKWDGKLPQFQGGGQPFVQFTGQKK
jgi:regulator of protease activity HflC (stomatin/prohibitin superfamily)